MSEPIEGVEFTWPEAPLREASVVILVRERDGNREVFWVRRGDALSFSGGFYAFPGGSVDDADAATPIADAPEGQEAAMVAAIRETFEESGVLLAQGSESLGTARREELRRELLGGASFGEMCAREGLGLEGSRLLSAGRWITPPFSPIRFDARFFLAQVEPDVPTSIIPGELSDGGWIRPEEGLARWDRGAVLLHPPNHHVLATLAGYSVESAIPRLWSPAYVDDGFVAQRIEFQRGIHFLPLRTPTLPPATHTNCYIVGTRELAIVDPGSPYPDEIDRLETFIRQLEIEGRRASCVLLTHHHGDHVGGAVAIGERLGVPVRSSRGTAERVPGISGDIADGETVHLEGPLPLSLQAILTEGHADGHLCFFEPRSRAVLAGDMVAGGSTIVIDPPEGRMGDYLKSLKRLEELKPSTLYPAHGFPIADGPAKLEEYLRHREARMEQLRAAVEEGISAIGPLVERVYDDTPEFLHPVAERSALASLIELEARGIVQRVQGAWTPVETA